MQSAAGMTLVVVAYKPKPGKDEERHDDVA